MGCRPLRLGGAFVLLTTAPDQRRPSRMQIKIQPQDEEEATLMLASNVRHLATADVPAPKVIAPPSSNTSTSLASVHCVPEPSLSLLCLKS